MSKRPSKSTLLRQLRDLGITGITPRAAHLASLSVALTETLQASSALSGDGGRRLEFSMFDLAVSSWLERVNGLLKAEIELTRGEKS